MARTKDSFLAEHMYSNYSNDWNSGKIVGKENHVKRSTVEIGHIEKAIGDTDNGRRLPETYKIIFKNFVFVFFTYILRSSG